MSVELNDQERFSILNSNAGSMRGRMADRVMESYHVISCNRQSRTSKRSEEFRSNSFTSTRAPISLSCYTRTPSRCREARLILFEYSMVRSRPGGRLSMGDCTHHSRLADAAKQLSGQLWRTAQKNNVDTPLQATSTPRPATTRKGEDELHRRSTGRDVPDPSTGCVSDE